MTEISVIDNSSVNITKIRFSDSTNSDGYEALDDAKGMFVGKITFEEGEGYTGEMVGIVSHDGDYIPILTKQDATNLIKALEKAIELGWYDIDSEDHYGQLGGSGEHYIEHTDDKFEEYDE